MRSKELTKQLKDKIQAATSVKKALKTMIHVANEKITEQEKQKAKPEQKKEQKPQPKPESKPSNDDKKKNETSKAQVTRQAPKVELTSDELYLENFAKKPIKAESATASKQNATTASVPKVHEVAPAGANPPVVSIAHEPKKNETVTKSNSTKKPDAPAGAAAPVVVLSKSDLTEAIHNTKWSTISQ